MERMVSITCCDCEPLAVALVRARLWPASPRFPKYAFSFDLLDWAEALLLECQVSLKDFCNALYFRCPYSVDKVIAVILCYSFFHIFYCLVSEERYIFMFNWLIWRISVIFQLFFSNIIVVMFIYSRFFKHELRHLSYLSTDLDNGNVCPACPKVRKNINSMFYAA